MICLYAELGTLSMFRLTPIHQRKIPNRWQTSQTTHFLNICKAHVGSLAAHLCGRARAIQRASARLQRSCCARQQVRGLPMPGAPHVTAPCAQRCCYQGDVVCQDIMAVHAQDCLQGEGLQAD